MNILLLLSLFFFELFTNFFYVSTSLKFFLSLIISRFVNLNHKCNYQIQHDQDGHHPKRNKENSRPVILDNITVHVTRNVPIIDDHNME